MSQSSFDRLCLLAGGLVLAAAFIAAAISHDAFSTFFGREDSPVENLTALVLFSAGAMLIVRTLAKRGEWAVHAVALGVLYGAVYIWAGGEEISWGQRLLGFETPEFFAENNDQGEFTIHNLVVGGVKLDESLFGPILSIVILTYLVVLPLMWRRFAWVKRLASTLSVPVPGRHHALYALAVTLIIPLLGESRRWEVYECIFALLSMGIFVNPANHLWYSPDAARANGEDTGQAVGALL